MKLFKKAKKGFTLVELVVVIAVIAILAGVSVGAYFGITETANRSAAEQGGKQLHTALLAVANDPKYDTSSDNIDIVDGKLDTTYKSAKLKEIFDAYTGLTYTFVDSTPNSEATNGTVYMADNTADFVYVTNGKVATVVIKTGAVTVA